MVIALSSRDDHGVSAVDLKIIRSVERGDFVFPAAGSVNKAFEEWVAKRFPGYNINTAKTKIIGYRPTYREHSWGIIAYQKRGDPPLRCVENFERFRFLDKATVPVPVPVVVPSLVPPAAENPVPETESDCVQLAERPAPVGEIPVVDVSAILEKVEFTHIVVMLHRDDQIVALDDESFAKHVRAVGAFKEVLPQLEERILTEITRRDTEQRRQADLEQKKATLLDEARQHEEAARRMREEIENIESALAKPAK